MNWIIHRSSRTHGEHSLPSSDTTDSGTRSPRTRLTAAAAALFVVSAVVWVTFLLPHLPTNSRPTQILCFAAILAILTGGSYCWHQRRQQHLRLFPDTSHEGWAEVREVREASTGHMLVDLAVTVPGRASAYPVTVRSTGIRSYTPGTTISVILDDFHTDRVLLGVSLPN